MKMQTLAVTNRKKVAFYTLGCKLNFSETSTIARDFNEENFERVDFDQPADIYVINTCSVTDNADKKFKGLVKKAMAQNSTAFIAAVGCYAQLRPEELADVNGVDLVLGASDKFKLTAYLNDLSKKEKTDIHACEIEVADTYEGSYSLGDRTRSFLKVQDGCDYKCTYCTIPQARGISRSDTLENVVKNAEQIARQNIREIVLTGVNIGDYGKGEMGNKKHEHTFLDLVQALDNVTGIDRFRISSIEPNLLKNETIDFVAQSKRFVPHFHIPLQSGSDTILKKMKRRYLTPLYFDRVARIKQVMPDCCIGVDVIVGFPGETEENFLETFSFLEQLPVSYFHVFTYSERPNTEAVLLENSVPQLIRNKRSKVLRALSAKKKQHFYASQIGKQVSVLFEGENKKGYIHGFTRNYVKVRVPWDPALVNQCREGILKDIDSAGYARLEIIT